MQIFSQINRFLDKYPNIRLTNEEILILQNYFESGGLVKTRAKANLQIVYPDKEKVRKASALAKNELDLINKKVKIWQDEKDDADGYLNKIKVKKYYCATYWKHMIKSKMDKQYKDDFERARIPLDLVADPKLRKIVNEFIENPDYREKLLETMDNSIIYQNKELGQQVLESIKIKQSIATKKLEVFYKRKSVLEAQIKAYKLISRWVVE